MDKVISWDALRNIRTQAREAGKAVVFTNGVFDLLHRGHVEYLEKARALGDLLVVGRQAAAVPAG
jgi:bifunctional ADP-heptose synthase (sugar kinase/adenylyltransferase)